MRPFEFFLLDIYFPFLYNVSEKTNYRSDDRLRTQVYVFLVQFPLVASDSEKKLYSIV